MRTVVNKNKGPFVDVLENMFIQLFEHQEHFLYYSLVDLDWSEIRCGRCKQVVAAGSKDLLDQVWLEVNTIERPS